MTGAHNSTFHISIHALHEESDWQSDNYMRISIHALHEESDFRRRRCLVGCRIISIHALHEESDLIVVSALPIHRHFNPRSP